MKELLKQLGRVSQVLFVEMKHLDSKLARFLYNLEKSFRDNLPVEGKPCRLSEALPWIDRISHHCFSRSK